MPPAPGDYGRAFADVYDRWYPADGGVAAHRLAALAGAGPVLELGVGTGRVALPLAAAGVPVWGIDASTEMLAVLAAKDQRGSVVALEADMAELRLPPGAPQFALVFAAFNTFFLLPTHDTQRRCLQRCREVLQPAGRLVLELYSPAPAAPGHDRWHDEQRAADGTTVLIEYERAPRDPRLLVGRTTEEGGGEHRPWALRPLPVAELDALASEAGFELEHRWGDWSGGRWFEHLGTHVSVWRASR